MTLVWNVRKVNLPVTLVTPGRAISKGGIIPRNPAEVWTANPAKHKMATHSCIVVNVSVSRT